METSPEAPIGITYHLVARGVWEAQCSGTHYQPEAFEADGFVHCTDGLEQLLLPANTYYRDDDRPYLALAVDLDAVAAPCRYDDAARIYPHIYGPVDIAAVRETYDALRADDGTFTGFIAR